MLFAIFKALHLHHLWKPCSLLLEEKRISVSFVVYIKFSLNTISLHVTSKLGCIHNAKLNVQVIHFNILLTMNMTNVL